MFTRMLFLILVPCLALAVQPIELEISSFQPSPRVTTDKGGTLKVSPGGAISLRLKSRTAIPITHSVLEVELFSLGGCETIHAIYGPQFQGGASAWKIAPFDHSERWVPYRTLLKKQPEQWSQLRLDLLLTSEASVTLRGARLRPPGPGEFESQDLSEVDRRDHQLQDYLTKEFPSQLSEVALTEQEVSIRILPGKAEGSLFIAEVPIFRAPDDSTRFESLRRLTTEELSTGVITLPRFRDREGRRYDRLTSRWQLVTIGATGERIPHSHARYPDRFPSAFQELPRPIPANKKGLGGWSATSPAASDIDELGITAITMNLVINTLLSEQPTKNTDPFQWQGRTYHANRQVLQRYDRTLQEAAKRNILVDAVILLSNPNRKGFKNPVAKLMGHPEADPSGAFAMPAMDSEPGVSAYGAALHLLAARYSRPDGKHGRIHNYIVHNEVDAGWSWTNCGEKPLSYFFDLYHRSMRLTDLITRSQDASTQSYITLTHHWAEPGNRRFYGSKYMLLELAKWTRTEGDFPWALAYHPYPASLFKPRTWEDKVTFDFDSDRITPHNIEVLDSWMRTPAMLDKDGRTRPIHLSENGFNSIDYSAAALRDQAAGMAYAWKKIQPLSTIVTWQYHNHIDNRHEGGLRIGLRRFPDDGMEPLGKKPIWHLYRELATPREEEACRPYLPVIGIEDWSEMDALRPAQTPSHKSRPPSSGR